MHSRLQIYFAISRNLENWIMIEPTNNYWVIKHSKKIDIAFKNNIFFLIIFFCYQVADSTLPQLSAQLALLSIGDAFVDHPLLSALEKASQHSCSAADGKV